MSRFRMYPTPQQEQQMLLHCAHARYVWNLAVEQQSFWRPGRRSAPGFAEQCRQLTEARAVFDWLRAGSVNIQQQALRDFAQAMANYFAGTHRRPTWRKAGRLDFLPSLKGGDSNRRRLGFLLQCQSPVREDSR